MLTREEIVNRLDEANRKITGENFSEAHELLRTVPDLSDDPELQVLESKRVKLNQQLRDSVVAFNHATTEFIRRSINTPDALTIQVNAQPGSNQFLEEWEADSEAVISRWYRQINEQLRVLETQGYLYDTEEERLADKTRQEDINRLKRALDSKRNALREKWFVDGVALHYDTILTSVSALTSVPEPNYGLVLASYLNPARETIKEQISRYPNNYQLQEIQARIERERAPIARRANVGTSIREGDFDNALKELEGLDDNAKVPKLDDNGIQIGTQTVAQAREDVLNKATVADTKVLNALLEQIISALNNNAPQIATDLIKRAEALKYADNQERKNLEKAKKEYLVAFGKYDSAERTIEQASTQSDPFNQWRLYVQAVGIYPYHPRLLQLQQDILSTMSARLHVMREDCRKSLEALAIDDVISYKERLKAYRELSTTDDQELSTTDDQQKQAIERELGADKADIQSYITQAEYYKDNINKAIGDLQRIETTLASNVQNADSELASLMNKYQPIVTNNLPGLPEIRASIDARLRVGPIIEELQDLLYWTDYNAVKSKYDVVNAVKDPLPELQTALKAVKMHLDLLDGKREFELAQYERAKTLLESVVKEAGANSSDTTEANALLLQIATAEQEASTIDTQLSDIEKISATDPKKAYETLIMFEGFTQAQKRRHATALTRARTAYVELLKKALSTLRPDFDPNDASDKLKELFEIVTDKKQYDDIKKRVYMRILARQSEVTLGNPSANELELEKAKQQLEEATKEAKNSPYASKSDKDRYDEMLMEARAKHMEKRMERIKEVVRVDEKGENNAKELQETLAQVEDLCRVYSGELAPQIWRIQLYLYMAQTNFDNAQRRDAFERADTLIKQVLPIVQQEMGKDGVTYYRTLASEGLRVAGVMNDIQVSLERLPSISEVVSASQKWHGDLRLLAERVDEFSLLPRWWERVRQGALGQIQQRQEALTDKDRYKNNGVMLALDPESTRSEEIVNDIVARSNITQQDAKRLKDSLKTARVDELLKRVQEQLELTDTLVQFANAFTTHPRFGDKIRGVGQSFRESNNDLRALKKTLEDFKSNLSELDSTLGKEKDSSRSFEESNVLLKKLRDEGYSNHPQVKELDTRRNRYAKERGELLTALDELRKLVREENYLQADDKYQSLSASDLEEYNLNKNLAIVDPQGRWGQESGRTKRIESWEDLGVFLSDRAGILKKIVDFARPFGIDTLIREQSGLDIGGNFTPIVDWAKASEEISSFVAEGKFKEALEKWEVAVTSENGSLLSIKYALDKLKNPLSVVPASQKSANLAGDYTITYQDAINACPNLPGKNILEGLYRRVPYYQELFATAEAFKQESIIAKRAEWERGWSDWEKAIADIAHQFDEAGGIDKKLSAKLKNALKTAVNQASNAQAICARACPRHLLVQNEMVNHWLFKRAKEKANA